MYTYPEGDAFFRALSGEADVVLRGDECFGMKWPFGIPDERSALACIGLFPMSWHGIYRRLVGGDALG
jgi:hypothetical protein